MATQGKVAVVTGAGTGIGLAIAERLSQAGAHVCRRISLPPPGACWSIVVVAMVEFLHA